MSFAKKNEHETPSLVSVPCEQGMKHAWQEFSYLRLKCHGSDERRLVDRPPVWRAFEDHICACAGSTAFRSLEVPCPAFRYGVGLNARRVI
jgi:hypothetical protein